MSNKRKFDDIFKKIKSNNQQIAINPENTKPIYGASGITCYVLSFGKIPRTVNLGKVTKSMMNRDVLVIGFESGEFKSFISDINFHSITTPSVSYIKTDVCAAFINPLEKSNPKKKYPLRYAKTIEPHPFPEFPEEVEFHLSALTKLRIGQSIDLEDISPEFGIFKIKISATAYIQSKENDGKKKNELGISFSYSSIETHKEFKNFKDLQKGDIPALISKISLESWALNCQYMGHPLPHHDMVKNLTWSSLILPLFQPDINNNQETSVGLIDNMLTLSDGRDITNYVSNTDSSLFTKEYGKQAAKEFGLYPKFCLTTTSFVVTNANEIKIEEEKDEEERKEIEPKFALSNDKIICIEDVNKLTGEVLFKRGIFSNRQAFSFLNILKCSDSTCSMSFYNKDAHGPIVDAQVNSINKLVLYDLIPDWHKMAERFGLPITYQTAMDIKGEIGTNCYAAVKTLPEEKINASVTDVLTKEGAIIMNHLLNQKEPEGTFYLLIPPGLLSEIELYNRAYEQISEKFPSEKQQKKEKLTKELMLNLEPKYFNNLLDFFDEKDKEIIKTEKNISVDFINERFGGFAGKLTSLILCISKTYNRSGDHDKYISTFKIDNVLNKTKIYVIPENKLESAASSVTKDLWPPNDLIHLIKNKKSQGEGGSENEKLKKRQKLNSDDDDLENFEFEEGEPQSSEQNQNQKNSDNDDDEDDEDNQ